MNWPDRFWRKVERSANAGMCWVWNGARIGSGYGTIKVDAKPMLAHRIAYELVRGQTIPHGMELDHLCRNRACVNPDHLEVVTHKQNLLRGLGVGSMNAAKTKCIHGHEFTDENTRRSPIGPNGNRRACRACNAIAVRKYQAKRRKAG